MSFVAGVVSQPERPDPQSARTLQKCRGLHAQCFPDAVENLGSRENTVINKVDTNGEREI
jgi:hypothetical protein